MVARDYGGGKWEWVWQQKYHRRGPGGRDGDALYLQRQYPGSDSVSEFYKIELWGK